VHHVGVRRRSWMWRVSINWCARLLRMSASTHMHGMTGWRGPPLTYLRRCLSLLRLQLMHLGMSLQIRLHREATSTGWLLADEWSFSSI
jgi:hypothetical protein